MRGAERRPPRAPRRRLRWLANVLIAQSDDVARRSGLRPLAEPSRSRGGLRVRAPRLSRLQAQLLHAYRTWALSPVEATRAALSRIEKLERGPQRLPRAVDADGAMEVAQASEARWGRGEPRGLLDGVPVSIKRHPADAGRADALRLAHGARRSGVAGRSLRRSRECASTGGDSREDDHARARPQVRQPTVPLTGIHPEPVEPSSAAPAAAAAAPPPRWPRGSARWRWQLTVGARSASRRRGAASSVTSPPPAAFPSGRRPGGERSRTCGPSGPHRGGRRAPPHRAGGSDRRDPVAPARGRPRLLGSDWKTVWRATRSPTAPTSGWPEVEPEIAASVEEAARTLEGSAPG